MENQWTDGELTDAVDAYVKMSERQNAGLKVHKAPVYRDLALKHGRTEKAFEYRMQNISAVLSNKGYGWLKGVAPAKNVGTNVTARIEDIIQKRFPTSALPSIPVTYKDLLPAMRQWLINVAKEKETVTYRAMLDLFEIDWRSQGHAMDALGKEAVARNEPAITALIVDENGHCSRGLKKGFGIEDDEAERKKLYAYWGDPDQISKVSVTESDPLAVRAANFAVVETRPEQARFRKRVFEAYDGRCAISGCDIVQVLDAAHRKGASWKLGHNLAQHGILLRKDLHALYDAGMLTISDSGRICLKVSDPHYSRFDSVLIKSDIKTA